MTDPINEPFRGDGPRARDAIESAQWKIAGFLVLATLGSIAAWSLSETGLERTGLYFIAIPGMLAAAITLLPTYEGNETLFGPIRLTLIVILASAIVVREGFICVLMASPFVLLIVTAASLAARRRDRRRGHVRAVIMLPLLLLGSVEGVAFDLPADDVGTEVRVVDATPDEIEAALAGVATLPSIEPLLFRLPFPMPTDVHSDGIEPGDRQVVSFEMGVLELQVDERTQTSVRWTVVADSTPIRGWYATESITIEWTPVAAGIELRVAIAYERQLAPAIYFGPLGRFGMGEMAEVLADMVEQNL